MPHKILIADDHPEIRQRLRTLLEGAGFLVSDAVNGREAVEKSKELTPDLVILDLSMPVLNGLQAIPKITELKTTKVVVLTIHENEELKRLALQSGAHGYVGKSTLPSGLLAEVNKLLGMALVVGALLREAMH